MDCWVNGVAVHYVEYGTGVPLVALHGAGVDHREIEAAVEASFPTPDTGGSTRTCRGWAARAPTALPATTMW
jgi:hypothetical protein